MSRLTYVTVLFVLASTFSAFAAVSVSSPGNGATVTTPFNLSADASSCSNQPVASMGYSLDNSSDTTVVKGTSLDASVPAPSGNHTLHVKAWGNQGAGCVTDVAITVSGSASASDGVAISAPANGATLTSPFTISGTSATCSGQPVAAMAYEIDSAADAPAVNGTSLSEQASASAGNHVVRLKSWGNQGAGCAASVNITVSGSGSSSTGSGTSTDGISVSSPGNGATVGSPFSLDASAGSCSGQPVGAMGYSLDSSSSTTTVNGTSVQASISAGGGSHTLHVKSWGNAGAGCVANIAINVSGATAAQSTTSATQGITVSSPGNGATVSSSFDVVASAGSCNGQAVSAMGYSLDNSSTTTTFSGTSFNAAASAGSGAHTVHVKSWGNGGAGCVDNVAITVSGGGSSSSGPSIPSNATSVSSLETLSNWKETFDGATSGSASGSMALVSSPSLQGNSRQYVTHYTNGGGERYYVSFGDDTSATNFVYDAWVYLTSTASQIANLEMDLNQVMPNGQTVIFGFQCDGYNNTWDVTKNAGSPSSYNDAWVRSGAACNPRNWGANAWHHVQVSYSRNSSGEVTYHTVWLDGKEQGINITVPSAFALGWAPSLVTNFQVDGLGSSGAPTTYLDKLTVYRW